MTELEINETNQMLMDQEKLRYTKNRLDMIKKMQKITDKQLKGVIADLLFNQDKSKGFNAYVDSVDFVPNNYDRTCHGVSWHVECMYSLTEKQVTMIDNTLVNLSKPTGTDRESYRIKGFNIRVKINYYYLDEGKEVFIN